LLRYFRINDPYRLLALLILMVLMALPLLLDLPAMTYPELRNILLGEKVRSGHSLYTQVIDSTGPLAGWFDGLISWMCGRSLLARRILALVIIFLQAAYLGFIHVNKKAYAESTLVPVLLFVALFFFSFDTFTLSPELLGSGFLLIALNNLFNEIELREQRNEPVFNLGLFISIASLFVFSYAVYLLAAIVILTVAARTPFRKHLLLLVGFSIPHLLIISAYYIKDGLKELWTYYYMPNLGFSSHYYVQGLWLLGIAPLFFLVASLFMLNRDARFTKYQSQLVQVMFLWMLFTVLQIFYSKEIHPQSFITLIPSFSFFMAHSLLMMRRKRFAEISLWTILFGVVGMGYAARYHKLPAVRYADLYVRLSHDAREVKNKKVLVLSSDMSVYKNNTLGSAFLNWDLSQPIFEAPEYYDNVLSIDRSFRQDPPDVIIDPQNKMVGVFKLLPELRKQYAPQPKGYNRISN